jgi:hypothetical protein
MAYSNELWALAKKRCRLRDEDIDRAKRLGLNPKSLIKNIPNKSEQWKAPVNVWLKDIEEKRERKVKAKAKRKGGCANGASTLAKTETAEPSAKTENPG